MACVEWTRVFSADISLMQEKGRGKEGGQEHLVFFFCYSIFSNFLTFHLVKKGRGGSREQERDGQKGQS